ncbi:MAG: sigma-70 family RNA polymerase sigma factor [Planctomycetaceae bacterium]|nr:sigma-70 family RNA polymerase sigma factor [Planctomycetaceae bacterium]
MSSRSGQFQEILERNIRRWEGIARCYAPLAEREDLFQQIALQVWKSLDQFNGKSHVDTWAFRVALNTALSWERSLKRRESYPLDQHIDVEHIQGSSPEQTTEQRILAEFLASLSKVDRAVMLLYLENTSNAEMADVLGLTEGAIRVRLYRLRQKFEETYCREGEST